MALFDVRGLPDYPQNMSNVQAHPWQVWHGILCREIPLQRKYEVTIDPTSINANSESKQTFTVTGLDANDIVTVNPSELESGIGIMWYRVSAANTLQVMFRNFTAGSIDPAAGTWLIKATRR